MSEVKVDEDIKIGRVGNLHLMVDVFRPSHACGLIPGILFCPVGPGLPPTELALKTDLGFF